MKLIIAGNIRQAKQYMMDNKISPHEYIIPFSEDRIRGLRNVEVIRTGEYWLNPIDKSEYLEVIEKTKDK